MRDPQQYTVDIDGDEFSVLEWPGKSDPILLLHATGFHSRCWTQVVQQLGDQHIYAADLRFHGGSAASGAVSWTLMAEDIRQLVERLDLRNAVGVGHSIGGHLVTRAAAALPDRFKQLVLIDPVIMAPERYDEMRETLANASATDHPVSRRKNRWQDAQEMFERFTDKLPFSTWQTEVLKDYCDYALVPADEDDYLALACDPLNEASIYLSQIGNEVVHEVIPTLRTPVTLLRAPQDQPGVEGFASSPTWPDLARHIPNCREIYLSTMNHFIPMQDPALVARYIGEAQAGDWRA